MIGADKVLIPEYDLAIVEVTVNLLSSIRSYLLNNGFASKPIFNQAKTRAVSVGFKQAKFDASVHLAGNAALLGVLTFGANQVASAVQSTF